MMDVENVTKTIKLLNNVIKLLHLHFACANNLLYNVVLYYKFQAEPVLESKNVKIYWDRKILSDITDITILDTNRPNNTCLLYTSRCV